MKYITSHELSEKWGISQRRIVRLALDGKISGARLYGRSWMFPEDSEKPTDGRTRECKAEKKPEPFRYPAFEHKDTSSFNPPLSDEELTIKAVLGSDGYYAGEFHERHAYRYHEIHLVDLISTTPMPRALRFSPSPAFRLSNACRYK